MNRFTVGLLNYTDQGTHYHQIGGDYRFDDQNYTVQFKNTIDTIFSTLREHAFPGHCEIVLNLQNDDQIKRTWSVVSMRDTTEGTLIDFKSSNTILTQLKNTIK